MEYRPEAHLPAARWPAARLRNSCAIGPQAVKAWAAATGPAHCLRVRVWATLREAIVQASEIDPKIHFPADPATVGVQVDLVMEAKARTVPAMVETGRIDLVTAARDRTVPITAPIGLGKAAAASNGGRATIAQTGPAAMGGRVTIQGGSTIGISGTTFAATIGRTSTTSGAIVGTTTGAIAITGSTAIGGTTTRATIGIGPAMGIGGAGQAGVR